MVSGIHGLVGRRVGILVGLCLSVVDWSHVSPIPGTHGWATIQGIQPGSRYPYPQPQQASPVRLTSYCKPWIVTYYMYIILPGNTGE
jgi:hypothetical protein